MPHIDGLRVIKSSIHGYGVIATRDFKEGEAIAGHLAFYPQHMDACLVDGELVQANDGDFYGGWITSKVVGPFKGAPGTWGW